VFATGSLSEREVVAELRSMGVGFRRLTPGKFSVVIPAKKVLPEQVPVTG
jgi:hypothetical protein